MDRTRGELSEVPVLPTALSTFSRLVNVMDIVRTQPAGKEECVEVLSLNSNSILSSQPGPTSILL